MLPSRDQFCQTMQSLGVTNKDKIVVYDSQGIFSSARVWLTFKYFGHSEVYILNGGLPAYVQSGGSVEKSETDPSFKTTDYFANEPLGRHIINLYGFSSVKPPSSLPKLSGSKTRMSRLAPILPSTEFVVNTAPGITAGTEST